jgi:metallo-beta-lactamase family protein
MRVTFFGGAGGVTGSKHLVELGNSKILLDCGMFQGHRREARLLNSALPFDPATINAVVLSHGHLDHCGMLPLMLKGGYNGKIYATAATRDVAEWILKDAAHIQKQDAHYMNRHRIEGAELAKPLYTVADVAQVVKRFVAVPYARELDGWFNLGPYAPNVKIRLYDAGHILGSSVTVLEGEENGIVKRLAFTGDLGRRNTPLLPDPEPIQEEVETLLLESTYGNRLHQPVTDAIEKLKTVIKRAYNEGGKIIVPSFALGRTQELVYVLHQLTDRGELPRLPIYVDSPLATHLTDVFAVHPEDMDRESWVEFGQRGEVPLSFRNLQYVRTQDESKALNTTPGPFVVIAASGMCEAGRILHHLANGIANPKNTVLITGFQAQNTMGRRLVEGVKEVRIYGTLYPVRAEVIVLNEFSAHADAEELKNYAEHTKGLKNLFLVHGETSQAEALAQDLSASHPDWQVRVAEHSQTFEL